VRREGSLKVVDVKDGKRMLVDKEWEERPQISLRIEDSVFPYIHRMAFRKRNRWDRDKED